MKSIIFVTFCLFFYQLFIGGYSQSTWSMIGPNDTVRYAAVNSALNRFFGIAAGDPCLSKFFGDLDATVVTNFRNQLLPLLCTLLGGDPSTDAQCQYTPVAGQPYYTTANVSIPMTSIHQTLGIKSTDFNSFVFLLAHYIAYYSAVDVTSQVTSALDALSSYIITDSSADTSICASGNINSTNSINWQLPVTGSLTLSQNNAMCFIWSDALPHTVEPTGTVLEPLNGYGSGASAQKIALGQFGNQSVCDNIANSSVPCYYTTGKMQYCHYFDTPGVYTFQCAVHGTSMTASITVKNPNANTNTDTSGGGNGSGNNGGSQNGTNGSNGTKTGNDKSAASSLSLFGLF